MNKRPVFDNLILHLHPLTIPEKTLKFTHTWGLGGMSLILILLLMVTGMLLLFVYEPTPEKAYASILTIQNDVLFGKFIRNIHHWSGNILVCIVFLHMLRVFFTWAFLGSRRLNWVIGFGLFFLVIISNFTGYLLPWDQKAFWAITISTGMLEYLAGPGHWLKSVILGGDAVGSTTLSVFFSLHVVIMPIGLFLFMPCHFWLVRKVRGVVIPRSLRSEQMEDIASVPTIPNLVMRELSVGLILIAFIMVFSLIFDAPLEAMANPGLSPNPTKAPWYFLGIQEMLIHIHPFFAVWVIPILMVGALITLPYFNFDREAEGVWFCSLKGRRMGIIAALFAFVVAPFAIVADSFFIDFTAWLPMIPAAISNGLIPSTIILLAITVFTIIMKKRYRAANNEAIQALFIFLMVTYILLLIIGYWFRGPAMALGWPWVGGQ